MITCIIKYQLDPYKMAEFEKYSKNWGQAIPECGADLIGYYKPHEGTNNIGYGIYNIENLAEYEAYRAKLANHPLGKENYEFALSEKFIIAEERTFIKNISLPHKKVFLK